MQKLGEMQPMPSPGNGGALVSGLRHANIELKYSKH